MYKYIGLDAHSSTCTLCVTDVKGTELDLVTIATNGRLLVEYIKSLGGTIIITFEECDLSIWLFELFKNHVHQVVVCNPAANVEYKKNKTDKLDARNLAKLLRGGFLRSVFHDGSSREKFRMLVSGYEDVVQEAVRLKNRLKTLRRRARLYSDKAVPEHMLFIEERLIDQLGLFLDIRLTYKDELKKHVRQFKEAKYIMSMPAIKDIQASKIIAHVVNPTRFRDKYKFWSYCGLVKHQRISGGRLYGSKRAYGNRTLKCVFKMASHSAIKSNGALRHYYDAQRSKGLSDSAARNAVARKIAAIVLSLWKNSQLYDEQKVLPYLTAQV